MSSWFERWRERQNDLAQGVDADLVRDNQKRYKVAFGLLGSAFFLAFLTQKIHLEGPLRLVVSVLIGGSLVAGFVLATWARQQQAFLRKPDAEEPPKIFK